MTVLEQLESTLETLGLTAVQARLPNLLEQAAQQEPGYTDFLLDVLKTEADARRSRYLRARLQLAHLDKYLTRKRQRLSPVIGIQYERRKSISGQTACAVPRLTNLHSKIYGWRQAREKLGSLGQM